MLTVLSFKTKLFFKEKDTLASNDFINSIPRIGFHQQQNVNTLFSIELQNLCSLFYLIKFRNIPVHFFFSFFFGSTYKFNPKTDRVVGPMKLHQFSRYRQSNHREPVTEKYITDFYKCLYEHNNNNNNQYTISLFLDITTL